MYYQDEELLIRDLALEDAQIITREEVAQGWQATVDKYLMRLMDAAEEIAAKYADTVYLGVGLHSGYGSAQRMYVKRGYIPDGRGAWYGDRTAEQYANYENDDDFCLYLFKKLR